MNVNDITPEQIRHFLQLHQVGWRRGARLMAPDASEDEQKRLGHRIKAIAARDRRATTPTTRPVKTTKPTPMDDTAPAVEDDTGELEDLLRRDLHQLEVDMAGMREKGSWSALVNATKERRAMRVQLGELIAAREDEDFDPLDIDQIVTEILELPVGVLRHPRLIEAVEAASIP
jgi:hypothetical protein